MMSALSQQAQAGQAQPSETKPKDDTVEGEFREV